MAGSGDAGGFLSGLIKEISCGDVWEALLRNSELHAQGGPRASVRAQPDGGAASDAHVAAGLRPWVFPSWTPWVWIT